ncbi:MAG: P1 family peptidase [Pseudomonadota bacterium]
MMRNCLSDVAGIRLGHADDPRFLTGATVALVDRPNVASALIPGGAPGTRDTALLEPERTVQAVDAVVLSGGSAFGLDAAGGVQRLLARRGIGLDVGGHTIPIAVQAIIFDLRARVSGGPDVPDHFFWDLGWRAAATTLQTTAATAVAEGSVGAGIGATTADLKGGFGSASQRLADGTTVAAMAVANAIGSVLGSDRGHLLAAPLERDGEFGGLGPAAGPVGALEQMPLKGRGETATTIACIATDATLDKAEAKRVAIMASGGFARALRPPFAPFDGDTVFSVATLRRPRPDAGPDLTLIGAAAADCLARAVTRGVTTATLPGENYAGPPTYRERFADVLIGS